MLNNGAVMLAVTDKMKGLTKEVVQDIEQEANNINILVMSMQSEVDRFKSFQNLLDTMTAHPIYKLISNHAQTMIDMCNRLNQKKGQMEFEHINLLINASNETIEMM